MLIGLVGKAGSGKDSVAQHLCATHSFTRHAFADKLKDILMDVFAMTREQVYKQSQKEVIDPRYGMSPRKLLQLVGTDWFRSVYPDIWVDYVLRHYDAMLEKYDDLSRDSVFEEFRNMAEPVRLVIPDVRFVNEAEKVRERGGIIWRIECPDNPKTKRLGQNDKNGERPENLAAHASEMELEQIRVDQTFSARYGELPRLYQEVSHHFTHVTA